MRLPKYLSCKISLSDGNLLCFVFRRGERTLLLKQSVYKNLEFKVEDFRSGGEKHIVLISFVLFFLTIARIVIL